MLGNRDQSAAFIGKLDKLKAVLEESRGKVAEGRGKILTGLGKKTKKCYNK
jgi:hypothetical protein